jgi:hypothetical protein
VVGRASTVIRHPGAWEGGVGLCISFLITTDLVAAIGAGGASGPGTGSAAPIRDGGEGGGGGGGTTGGAGGVSGQGTGSAAIGARFSAPGLGTALHRCVTAAAAAAAAAAATAEPAALLRWVQRARRGQARGACRSEHGGVLFSVPSLGTALHRSVAAAAAAAAQAATSSSSAPAPAPAPALAGGRMGGHRHRRGSSKSAQQLHGRTKLFHWADTGQGRAFN